MILIADSGSTKTDWALISIAKDSKPIVSYHFTQGLNPIHQSAATIKTIITKELLTHITKVDSIDKVFFYGAGCTKYFSYIINSVLQETFPCSEIEVEGDLLGASKALYGNESGIACILGTGSNSCYYDGENIIKNIPALGFILGDEGSGAAIGKSFINSIFKERLSSDIRDLYLKETKLDYKEIISNVYSNPLPNRFLASCAKFIAKHIEYPELQSLVKDNFNLFFKYNLLKYLDYDTNRIAAVGSIAFHFRSILEASAVDFGMELTKVIKSPIDGLTEYHIEKLTNY